MPSTPRTVQNEVPRLISVDDHVVEPAHVWESRLPAKYREVGPHVVIAPRGEFKLHDGVYREEPGDGKDMAVWWHYEDHRFQLKQIIACPGLPPEHLLDLPLNLPMTVSPIGLDNRAART